jgi:hypothetical protein
MSKLKDFKLDPPVHAIELHHVMQYLVERFGTEASAAGGGGGGTTLTGSIGNPTYVAASIPLETKTGRRVASFSYALVNGNSVSDINQSEFSGEISDGSTVLFWTTSPHASITVWHRESATLLPVIRMRDNEILTIGYLDSTQGLMSVDMLNEIDLQVDDASAVGLPVNIFIRII